VIFLSTAKDSIFERSSTGREGVPQHTDFSAAKIAVRAAPLPYGDRCTALL